METKIVGNPDGWYAAWEKMLEFVGDYNPTPVAPVVIVYILSCGLILWGCWWTWTTWIREPAEGGQ